MAGGTFQYIELWQGRLSAVYQKSEPAPPELEGELLLLLDTLAEAAERVLPVVRRNWGFARFWRGGGGLIVLLVLGLLLASLGVWVWWRSS